MDVILDSGFGKEFDEQMREKGVLTGDSADLVLTTKNCATEAGRPVAAITFTVQGADTVRKVRAVVTVTEFLRVARILKGKYW